MNIKRWDAAALTTIGIEEARDVARQALAEANDLRETNRALLAQLDEARAEIEQERRATNDLLCVINGDGGHALTGDLVADINAAEAVYYRKLVAKENGSELLDAARAEAWCWRRSATYYRGGFMAMGSAWFDEAERKRQKEA